MKQTIYSDVIPEKALREVAKKIVKDKEKSKPALLATFNCTDMGNAKRLVWIHGVDLRFCYTWRKWLVYDGLRWVKDDTGEVFRRAKETVQGIYEEAAAAVSEETRKELAKHAVRSESEARIKAMVSLAESEPGIPVTTDQFDADQWLLNVANGTIDLRTSELRPHRREDLITKICPVEYHPKDSCPTWLAFLERIMDGNTALMVYLQKAMGYSLTGSTREKAVFLCHGVGDNGKTTLVNAVMELMGDYAMSLPLEALMERDRNAPTNDIARLKGARFVAGVETEAGRKMSEVLVKQLSGQDVITARFLHQEFFEFKPTCKIFIATNYKPVIRGDDLAIWRRVRLIPFETVIPPTEQDKELPDKLREELPGILAWAVHGAVAWFEDGLGEPEEVKAATEGYRSEMDSFSGFIEENCLINPTIKASAASLYEAYSTWCKDSGARDIGQRNFGLRLTERGFNKFRGTGGRIFWEGIGLFNS
ncbi:MAG: DNA primase family protein [Eubacteriales bacterium]